MASNRMILLRNGNGISIEPAVKRIRLIPENKDILIDDDDNNSLVEDICGKVIKAKYNIYNKEKFIAEITAITTYSEFRELMEFYIRNCNYYDYLKLSFIKKDIYIRTYNEFTNIKIVPEKILNSDVYKCLIELYELLILFNKQNQ